MGKSTVQEFVDRAQKADLNWPFAPELDDAALENLLFPPHDPFPQENRQMPAMEEIHRERKRKGVTLQLLWYEYKIVDRMVHRSIILHIQGPTWSMDESEKINTQTKKTKGNPCPPLASIPSSLPSRSSLHDDLNKKVSNTDQTATAIKHRGGSVYVAKVAPSLVGGCNSGLTFII
jgi:hypothetical protein